MAVRPLPAVAVSVAFSAAVLWALVVLFDWFFAVLGLSSGLAVLVLTNDRGVRVRERGAREAVRAHRDPGPGLRTEADAQARTLLAASAVDRWGAPVVLLGLSAACVVTAILRGDPVDALPAAPLAALTPVAVALRRRADAAADRWLADPPAPSEVP